MKTQLFFLAAFLFLSGCTTVKPGERGILWRPFSREVPLEELPAGTYATAPWNDLTTYDLRWRTAVEKADVQTEDKLHMVVPTSVVYRVASDRILAIHQTLGPDFYTSTVRPALLTAIRTEFAHRQHEVVVPKAAELQRDILTALRERLATAGIEVDSVTFQDLDYPQRLARLVEDSMAVEQEIKNKGAQLTLVQREQEISSQRSRGEAESRLAAKEAELAIAKRDAEIALTRSQAEAESVRTRAASLTPAYLKLRVIEAQDALARSPNTKLLLMPVGKDGVPLSLHSEERTP